MGNKFEASMAIQILPMLQQKEDIIKIIDKVIENIKLKNINMVVSPFETVVEGTLDEIMALLKESILIAEKEGAKNLLTYVKISYSPLGVMSIDEKISKYNI